MPERWITALRVEDAGAETPAATRERLKSHFSPGATRRMSQLGLVLGTTLQPLNPGENHSLVYASTYGETRALEGYLDSFPSPSPTLFQTSIHPSAVQQTLIQRQQPVCHFFPVTGGETLPAQALLVALLTGTPRTLLCGGEERGSWLLEKKHASDRTFAFALALSSDPAGAIGHICIDNADAELTPTAFPLPVFFNYLRDRCPFNAVIPPGCRLVLRWFA